MRTQVRKIGNSLGNIIPSAMIHQLKLKDGDSLDVRLEKGKIVIEPIKRNKIKIFTLEELLCGDIYTADDNLTAKPLDSEWID